MKIFGGRESNNSTNTSKIVPTNRRDVVAGDG